jgi:hypothetical protein
VRVALKAMIAVACAATACGETSLDAELAKDLVSRTHMPSCAQGARTTVEGDYDGLSGRDLSASFLVDDACKEAWLKRLESAPEFECEEGAEFRACGVGSIFPGERGISVMPRSEDMLVLVRNGKIRDKQGNWK